MSFTKTLRVMKLTAILLVCCCVTVSAAVNGQKLTYKRTNAPLALVFRDIEKLTKVQFLYFDQDLVAAKNVSVDVKDEELTSVLNSLFKDQPLTFTIRNNTVLVKRESEPEKKSDMAPLEQVSAPPYVHGRITNEKGEPVAGVSITIKGGKTVGVTNDNGEFTLTNISDNAVLVFSAVTIEAFEMKLNGKTELAFTAKAKINQLEEIVVNKGYYTTTQRLNTGSVGVIKGEDISKQPVTNLLAALEGRVNGMVVVQSNGVPGSSFSVQIRGQNSLLQGSDPLFIIDGVPFAPGNSNLNKITVSPLGSAIAAKPGGLSPFSSINPGDIESIEVLRDADALSIYGSRGANGVVLITTKKGKQGRTRFSATVATGSSKITHFMDMLNTQQYLSMRREAFKNDGVAPTTATAPDLLVWDTTRYTDLKQLLIGGTAKTTDAQLSFSGGKENTSFILGGSYHRETSVFPGDGKDQKANLHFNLNQSTADKRLELNFSASYTADKNSLIGLDLSSLVTLPPNLPALYDSAGRLSFVSGGVTFNNPLAYTQRPYIYRTDNLVAGLQLNYLITHGLSLRLNTGYSYVQVLENLVNPIASQNPAASPVASTSISNNAYRGWTAEPQLEYSLRYNKLKFSGLAGGSWQQTFNRFSTVNASGYATDALIGSIGAASSVTGSSNAVEYHYNAIYTRLNFNWDDTYLINLTGRRDGSSRFGQGKQFGDFGSVGGAWLFTRERFVSDALPFLSFGKLRGSYGTTGNDQIGDYQYLDTWTNTAYPYAGTPALQPTRLSNPDYSWEINRKIELGMELGFFKDKWMVSVAWYRNRSSNQLVNYSLPLQTGFASILENFPAVLENKGWEFLTSFKQTFGKEFTWNAAFNISLPKNTLLDFPGLASSSYASTFTIGRSTTFKNILPFAGVDPATGIFSFVRVTGLPSSSPVIASDRVPQFNTDPQFYGGLRNSFSYKGWSLDIFTSFKKQWNLNYTNAFVTAVPGTMANVPVELLARWQQPGDITSISRFSTTTANAANVAIRSFYGASTGAYTDVFYARIKNINVSYSLPGAWIRKARLETVRVYFSAQNLFTLTNYQGNDPETANMLTLPPLKTITAGIQVVL